MSDPFPPAPAWLVQLTKPLANALNLQTLPLHIHEVIFFALLYHVLCAYFSPWISTLLFPKRYRNFPARTRLNWDVHVVSLIQSTIVNSMAFYTIYCDGVRWSQSWYFTRHNDPSASQLEPALARVWGYTPLEGHVVSMAVGYFLWDLVICAVHMKIFGIGLLLHAIAALTVYTLGFTPFVNYYSPVFILYECSSPALNIHWFLDKVDLTGSSWQWYNGVVLISSFGGSRLIWGTYAGFRVFWDIWQAMHHPLDLVNYQRRWLNGTMKVTQRDLLGHEHVLLDDPMRFAKQGTIVSPWRGGIYLTCMVTLSILNFYWFNTMIQTVRSRFEGPNVKGDTGYHSTATGAEVLADRKNLTHRKKLVGA